MNSTEFSLEKIYIRTLIQVFHTILISYHFMPYISWSSANNFRLRTLIPNITITWYSVYLTNSVCKYFQLKCGSSWLPLNPKFKLSNHKIYSWNKILGIFRVIGIPQKPSLEIWAPILGISVKYLRSKNKYLYFAT